MRKAVSILLAVGLMGMSSVAAQSRRPRVILPESEYGWLRAHSFVAPTRGAGPLVVIIGGDRGASLGPWEFPPTPPARRLDGTLLDQPVQVYGGNPYGVYSWPSPRSVAPRPHEHHRRTR